MAQLPSLFDREIGSDFGLSLKSLLGLTRNVCHENALLGTFAHRYLGSGRDAFHWCIRSLRLVPGDKVLLPAYICEDVVNPFLESGLSVTFYKIKSDLTIDIEDLKTKLYLNPRLLLYVHYFGFQSNITETIGMCLPSSCVLLEDSSHSLLSRFNEDHLYGDIGMASLRKLFPVPNGGVVYWRNDRFQQMSSVKTQSSLWLFVSVYSRCVGGILKNIWGYKPGIYKKKIYRKFFAWSENLIDKYRKPAGMSVASKNAFRSTNHSEIVTIRRRNYQYLRQKLLCVTNVKLLYDQLPEGVCPLGMPIVLKDRDRMVDYLNENRVFTPIHWRLPSSIDKEEFNEAWSLSDSILTIPVDQRYSEKDMDRISDLLKVYQGT